MARCVTLIPSASIYVCVCMCAIHTANIFVNCELRTASKWEKHAKNVINAELSLLTSRSLLNWINFAYSLRLEHAGAHIHCNWEWGEIVNETNFTYTDYRVYLKMVFALWCAIWINSALNWTKIVLLFCLTWQPHAITISSWSFSKRIFIYMRIVAQNYESPKTMTITLEWGPV